MSDETPGPIAQGTAWLFARAHDDAMATVQGIPGPTPRFPLGNLGDFVGERPWEVLARYVRAYPGNLVCWWWGGEPVVTPASPAAARDRTREIVRTRRTGDDRRQAGRPSDPTEGTFSPLSATASSAGSSRSAGRIPDASASRSPSAR